MVIIIILLLLLSLFLLIFIILLKESQRKRTAGGLNAKLPRAALEPRNDPGSYQNSLKDHIYDIIIVLNINIKTIKVHLLMIT